MTNIDEIIEIILRNALVPEITASASERETARDAYAASFEGEGNRKIRFVVEDLRTFVNDARSGELQPSGTYRTFDTHRAAVLSVGGADGSDALALMVELGLKGGVLLEYDNASSNVARERAAKRFNESGQKLEVVTGDATQQLDAALNKAKMVVAGADTLIVVCFGVLHELPLRSPGYSHSAFFDRLFSAFPTVLVYCAEPCAQPEQEMGWPKIVELGFSSVESQRLAGVARFVADRLFQGECTDFQPRSRHMVRLDRDLAVEVLHKILRFSSVERFYHEMQERLTSFNVQRIVREVTSRIEDVEPEVTYRTSDGFRMLYRTHAVEARAENGASLSAPFTHCRLILRRFAPSQMHRAAPSTTAAAGSTVAAAEVPQLSSASPASEAPKVVTPAPAGGISISFNNNAGRDVRIGKVETKGFT